MKLTCPNCQEQLSLAAIIEHEAAREAIQLALAFPAPLGKQLLQYAGLFKPAQRILSMDRFASIMNELLPMIKSGQVQRHNRVWAAPQAYWQQAFDSMLSKRNTLSLPLKSHGYLLEIIASYSNKVEAAAERKAEQGRQFGEVKTADKPAVVKPKKPAVEKKPSKRSTKPVNLTNHLKNVNGKAGQDGK